MADALGDLQLQVMEVVWRLGRATVAEVHEALSGDRRIAYTTVLTTMRALERRGMLRHETVGRAFRYEPAVSRNEYTQASVRKLVGDLFDGRREKLLCHLLGAERITRADLDRIRRVVRSEEGRKP